MTGETFELVVCFIKLSAKFEQIARLCLLYGKSEKMEQTMSAKIFPVIHTHLK